MPRVSLDQAICQGHGRCAILAPEVFDVDDYGKGVVLVADVDGELIPLAREAAFSCPESAITVTP